jgi:hypothetical protein
MVRSGLRHGQMRGSLTWIVGVSCHPVVMSMSSTGPTTASRNPSAVRTAPGDPRRADELLMLTAVTATCSDCGDQRIFMPVDETGGEFCCTSCDAAVFLLLHLPETERGRRVA